MERPDNNALAHWGSSRYLHSNLGDENLDYTRRGNRANRWDNLGELIASFIGLIKSRRGYPEFATTCNLIGRSSGLFRDACEF